MVLNRRRFLQGSAAALAASPVLAHAGPRSLYIGARLDAQERAFVGAFDDAGRRVFEFALPARGHGFALRPGAGSQIVAFARRPGRFMIVADGASGHVLRAVASARNRRFCGHGAFSARGHLLYATELEFDTGDGVIGVYDARAHYKRVGEFRSGGLDPHEIALLPDGETLVVANGGILIDPTAPGVKLNVAEMVSSLAYIRAGDGALLAHANLPKDLFQLSLRHIDVAPNGEVAVVMQYEGPQGDGVPLVASHRRNERLSIVDLPPPALHRLRNYCGSVKFDATGSVLAMTSPVGGAVVLWDCAASRCIDVAEIDDCCGLAPSETAGDFVVTSGLGGGSRLRTADGVEGIAIASRYLEGARWDNHLRQVYR